MKAAVYTGPGSVEISTVPDPIPVDAGDVIVRIERCGICGSDLRALAVPPELDYQSGVVIGHEFVGEVVDGCGASGVRQGERVAVLPNIPCRRCHYCRNGRVNLCTNFTHLGSMRDGGAAEFAAVPAEMLHHVPEGLDWEVAALTEPLACVLNGVHRARFHHGMPTLVLGAGPIGLLFLAVARLAGAAPIIVSEPQSDRRSWAARLGADIVCDPKAQPLKEVIANATDGIGVEVAIDAVGTLLPDAVSVVQKGGRVLVFGLNFRAEALLSPAEIASREIVIEGVYIANGTFPRALSLLAERPEIFRPLITHRLPLDDFWEGVRAMQRGSAVKVILDPTLSHHESTGAEGKTTVYGTAINQQETS
jgi:2-desacetyl-2-hydroxyethyl bacteriochlorophyllide A dehydrogenase